MFVIREFNSFHLKYYDNILTRDNKKNPKADIGRNSSLYFALGLALMMFLSYGTINYKVYDKSALDLDKVNMDLSLIHI